MELNEPANTAMPLQDYRWKPKRSAEHPISVQINRLRRHIAKITNRTMLPLTIVSGADQSHALPLRRFLHSALTHERDAEIIVYDLGLNDETRSRISQRVELRKFDFSAYPAFFDIKKNAGEYAWKPTILNEISLQRPGRIVCWMDAGNILKKRLTRLRYAVLQTGFYSPIGFWHFGDWAHPKMLSYFDLPNDWRSKSWTLTGGCVAFDTRNKRAMSLLSDWTHYAAIKDCIAPEGSNRSNHRQDQALLGLLAYRARLVPWSPPSNLDFLYHQDHDCSHHLL